MRSRSDSKGESEDRKKGLGEHGETKFAANINLNLKIKNKELQTISKARKGEIRRERKR